MTYIFLSPHLDDAVFSCGGLIAKLVYQREKTIVLTVYTKKLDLNTISKKFHKFAIYDQRKKEDKRALERLGAEYAWMDLTERAFRNPKLKRLSDVFKLNVEDGISQFSNIYKIHELIDEYIKKYPDVTFYVPLGIGNHFDHIEVFLAALIYMVDEALYSNFKFYVDAYGIISTRIRKKHFLGRKLLKEGVRKPQMTNFRFFFTSLGISSMISGSNFEKMLKPKYRELNWEIEEISIKGYENIKLTALENYESQLKIFGEKEVKEVIRQFHKNWDDSEVYFNAKPSLI